MTSRSIKNEDDLRLLFQFLKNRKRPFTVDIQDGRKRSENQNSLQHLWIKEAAEQLEQSVEELRAFCKLRFGVPILRRDSEQFRDTYDRLIKPLSYEDKIEAMIRFDWPVTRLMTVPQKTEYLSEVERCFLEQGCVLTSPEARRAA